MVGIPDDCNQIAPQALTHHKQHQKAIKMRHLRRQAGLLGQHSVLASKMRSSARSHACRRVPNGFLTLTFMRTAVIVENVALPCQALGTLDLAWLPTYKDKAF